MPINAKIINSLQKIVGLSNVLADVEDLYVYSFEHIFRKQQYPTVKAIAKTRSPKEIEEILKLDKEQNFTIVLRSKGTKKQTKEDIVLIDDTKPIELKPQQQKKLDKTIDKNIKEIHRTGHGTPKNIVLALDTIFRSKPFSRYQENSPSSSYCTVVSSFNHIETWSSKGRTLLMKGLAERHLKPSKKLADILYTCSTCGQCFAEDFQGLEIDKAIKEARYQLAEKGLMPEIFIQTAKNIAELGDPSGMPLTRRLQWTKTLPELSAIPQKAETLYWIGCMVATRTPNTAKAMANILKHANINFTMLGEKEGCCNYVLLAAGLWNEAKKEAKKLLTKIKKTNASQLITPCAGCYYTFTKLYPEILEIEMPLEIYHASQFIDKLLHKHSLELRQTNIGKVTYHDPCSLGRHSNVYESPRNVLKNIKNLEFIEMPLNRNQARCCGGGGGLWTFNSQVSLDCAAVRLKNDIKPLDISILATACPTCQLNFRFSSIKNSVPIKTYDIAEIVESALN